MKRFFFNSLLFLLINIFVAFVIIFIVNSNVNSNAIFRIDKAPKFIVFGNSHPQNALNEDLISNFSNNSEGGETFFYTYPKLKKIIEQNIQLTTVFIEVNCNFYSQELDRYIYEEPSMSDKFNKYSAFMSFDQHSDLLIKNPKAYLNNVIFSARKYGARIKYNNYSFYYGSGGYLPSNDVAKKSVLSKSNEIILEEKDYSYSNLEYLKRIVSYCLMKNKKVFFIRCPIHKNYPFLKYEKYFSKTLKSHFPNIKLLDFKNFPLKDNEFSDLEHLNSKGAKVFSVYFDDFLRNKLFKIN